MMRKPRLHPAHATSSESVPAHRTAHRHALPVQPSQGTTTPCQRRRLTSSDSQRSLTTVASTPSHTARRLPPIMTRPARPARSRRRHLDGLLSASAFLVYALIALFLAAVPVSAVRVPFTNCLDEKYITDGKLQWKPVYADASFDTTDPTHELKVVVWGNVTGFQDPKNLPPSAQDDPNRLYWKDNGKTNGKITQTGDTGKATTLYRRVNVLTYRPVNERVNFCTEALDGGQCPLGPFLNTSRV